MEPLHCRGWQILLNAGEDRIPVLLIEALCFEPFRPRDQLSSTLRLAGHSSRSSKLRHLPPRRARERDNCNGHTSEPEHESRIPKLSKKCCCPFATTANVLS